MRRRRIGLEKKHKTSTNGGGEFGKYIPAQITLLRGRGGAIGIKGEIKEETTYAIKNVGGDIVRKE